ncbi:MAG: VOC family protein [Kofleriaceae bacterium]
MQTSRDVFQVEIRTRNMAKAMAFYGSIFDWKIYPSAPDYALIDAGVMPVIALLQTTDTRFPLGVVNNVLVEDCQQTADLAVQLGGRICVGKTETPAGAFVGTLDPWGNELFLWQPYTTGRPSLRGSGENPMVLLEIASTDLPGSIEYYSKLVGWSFWSVVFTDNYAMAEGCGLQRGVGLLAVPVGGGTTNYVAVADLAETEAKVRAAGGRILVEPADFPGEGRFFIFEDPEGNRMGALERRPA